ncbi:M48 family metalloprotease [Sinomicrobium oceani]|uniref:hypothetical protein n=1 Tax=Sinomicrobium oceani TaxID=1150368 RepID=UPI00227BFF7C|nr:hypothetical protein [Sinomicrobium oceani]
MMFMLVSCNKDTSETDLGAEQQNTPDILQTLARNTAVFSLVNIAPVDVDNTCDISESPVHNASTEALRNYAGVLNTTLTSADRETHLERIFDLVSDFNKFSFLGLRDPVGEPYREVVEHHENRLRALWDMNEDEIIISGIRSDFGTQERFDRALEQIVANDVYTGNPEGVFHYLYDNYPGIFSHPYFTINANAVTLQGTHYINLGDGMLDILDNEAGDNGVLFVFAHEWAHLVQNNNENWERDYEGEPTTAEITRFKEVEADFLSAYYLCLNNDKGGVGLDWETMSRVSEMVAGIGDCNFESDGHHGTPNHRRAAAWLGYRIAAGHVNTGLTGDIKFTAQQLHTLLMAVFENILRNEYVEPEQLQRPFFEDQELNAIYNELVRDKDELWKIYRGSTGKEESISGIK